MSVKKNLDITPYFKELGMTEARPLLPHFKVLDKGYISLVNYSARDLDVVNAARVSFHSESESMDERNTGLINFLMREHHGTPFEHSFFKFKVKAPLFVFREWHRHRVGHSYNEWSARYSKLEPDFYIPAIENVVEQHGKPGNYEFAPIKEVQAVSFTVALEDSSNRAYENYLKALDMGIAKQQARLFLPVNIYSEMYWSCNPRSLMHFCSLRNSDNAQMEIREYAQAAEEVLRDKMPVTHKSFVDNGRVAP